MIPGADPDEEWLRSTAGWWLLAFALAGVVIAALRDYLGWFVFGIFLYYVSRPVSRALQRRGSPPGISAIVTLVVVVLPFASVLFVVASLAIVQLATLDVTDFESVFELFFPNLNPNELPTTETELYPFAENLATDPTIASVWQWASGVLSQFFTASYLAFLALVLTFFLIRDERRLAQWFRIEIVDDRSRLSSYLHRIDRGLQSIFFGYTVTIFVIIVSAGVIYMGLNAIAPTGLEIPSILLLAVVTGLASAVPLIGRTIVYAGIVAYLVVQAVRTDPTALWFPIVFYVVMGVLFDGLIRTYVRPTLSGRMFPTGLVVFAYLLGPPVFGWYGIFLGPIIMVVTVLFVREELPWLLHGRNEFESGNDQKSKSER
ncbi:AI-2E family transporter (plasmid) [Haloferacaceae archaeon DSL9]